MGMILRIASSRIVGQRDIVGRSGYFNLNYIFNYRGGGGEEKKKEEGGGRLGLRIIISCC